MCTSWCPIFLCIIIIMVVHSYPITSRIGNADMLRLYRHLLVDYQPDVRPARMHNLPLNVTFSFSLTQIIDVDERNQIITTNAWIRQNWIDYTLRWRPHQFGNITQVHIPSEKLWKPDVLLYNNADSHYKTSVMSTDMFVTYNGNVTWVAAAIFKSSCPMNVRYYPFDEQSCLLKFASWAYDGTKIDLLLNSQQGDITNYMNSTEWHLLSINAEKKNITYSCCPEPYPFIDIYIRIQRRPMFYVFNLILPCVLISGIAMCSFFMPSDSGEKVTLGLTSLLTMTVLLMNVAETTPPTSDQLPLIGMYYGVTICIVSLATAMTVFTLNVHHQGLHGAPVPAIIQYIAFNCIARSLCLRIESYHSISNHAHHIYRKQHANDKNRTEPVVQVNGSSNSPRRKKVDNNIVVIGDGIEDIIDDGASGSRLWTNEVDNAFEREFLKILNQVQATIERNELRMAEKDRRDTIRLEWQQVALVLDRFLLVVFIVGTAAISLAIIFQRPVASVDSVDYQKYIS